MDERILMDERKHLILLKGKIKAMEIQSIKPNEQGKGYDMTFERGGSYTYGFSSVVWLREPVVKNLALYRIVTNGKSIDRINGIFVFGENEEYWHITTANGYART